MGHVYRSYKKKRNAETGCLEFVRDAKGRKITHPAWRYTYTDRFGKRRAATGTTTKKATEDLMEEKEVFERKIRTGERDAPKASDKLRKYEPTVDEYLEFLGTPGAGRGGFACDPRHISHRGSHLSWWGVRLKLKAIQDIDQAKAQKALQDLHKIRAHKTVEHYRESVCAFCDWLVKQGYLSADPLADLKPTRAKPKNPNRLLTSKELGRLLEVAPYPRNLLYRVALSTGFRLNELRALKVRNLDPFGPCLSLPAEFAKNRNDATQPIPRELANELDTWTRGRDNDADAPLLHVPKRAGAWNNFEGDLEKAGIVKKITGQGKATFHSLRVCYIQAVVQSGADLKTIMALARHSSAQMSLETYAKEDQGAMREAAERAAEATEERILNEYRAKSVAVGSATSITTRPAQTGYIHSVGKSGSGSSPGRVTNSNLQDSGNTPPTLRQSQNNEKGADADLRKADAVSIQASGNEMNRSRAEPLRRIFGR